MLRYIFVLSVILTLCGSIQLKTRLGEIVGSERRSRDGRTYHAFTGIPYAKPPVGKLRLRNPEEHGPWQGVLDASKPVQPCLQAPIYVFFLRNITLGQEDCLFLNVFVPQINNGKKLPVMVYIHGGGFRSGSPGEKDSADYFMDEDVVLVSVQYRLGTLGFLSLENSVIPGNFGLKDQSMALRWLKNHIADFGGDPESITIFGESAGGESTHLHAMSPLSKDILKGTISQSGVVNHYWGLAEPGTARPLAEKVIEKFGCSAEQDEVALECLQNTDPVQLIKAEIDFLYWDFNPVIVFRAVREPSGNGAFLDFDPFMVKTDIPWVVGIIEEEANTFLGALEPQDASVTQQYIDNFDEFTKRLLFLENYPDKENIKKSIKLVKEKYFREPMTISSIREDMVKFLTDCYFLYPMNEAVKKHIGPVYQYYNSYRGGSSLVDIYGVDRDLGTNHADELLLLFNWKEKFPKTKPGEEQVSKKLIKMWTNFAKYGNPSTDDLEWPELRASNGKYLHISENSKVSDDSNRLLSVAEWWSRLPVYIDTSRKTEL